MKNLFLLLILVVAVAAAAYFFMPRVAPEAPVPVPDRDVGEPGLPAVASKNLLPNSGFELGLLRVGLGRMGFDGGEALVVGERAFEGSRSLRFSITPAAEKSGFRTSGNGTDNRGYWVQIEGVRVEPGRPYVLSGWVRGDAAMQASIGVSIAGKAPWLDDLSTPFEDVGSDWRRIVLPIPASMPYGEPAGLLVNLFVDSTARAAGSVWFDALQLEPGETPSPYAPAPGPDLGVTTDEPLNIFDSGGGEGAPVVARLAVTNGDPEDREVAVAWDLKNWDGRLLQSDRVVLDVPAGQTVRADVDFGVLPEGYAIGDFRIEGTGHGQWLRVAVIHKRPTILPEGENKNPVFNMHVFRGPTVTTDAIVAAGTQGGREYQSGWRTPPPTEGPSPRQEWTSSRVARHTLLPRNLHALIGVNTAPLWIEGVAERIFHKELPGGSRSPEELHTMLGQWVAQNKDWLDDVESKNEIYTYIPMPDGDVSAFMEYFRTFYKGIKDADPSIDVVHNVVYDINSIHNLLGPCMKEGLAGCMDVLSFHYYGFGAVEPEEFLATYIGDIQQIMREHGAEDIPLYFTEFGGGSIAAEDDPHLDLEVAGFPPLRISEVDAAKHMVRLHLVGLSMGVERFYYFLPFDNQGIPGRNNAAGLLRHDGMPRPGYAAYAQMTRLLRDRRFVREVRLEEDAVRAYIFDGKEGPVAVLCRGLKGLSGRLKISADNPVSSGRWFDMVGGSLAWQPDGSGSLVMDVDDAPRYLVADAAMDGAALADALGQASLAEVVRPVERGKVPPQPRGTTYFIEAEDAFEQRGGEIDHKPGLYSGKGWRARTFLRGMPEGGFYARYGFYLVSNATYRPWIAGSPAGAPGEDFWTSPIEYRINGGPWQQVSREKSTTRWPGAGLDSGDHPDLEWMPQEPVTLGNGEHTIDLRIREPRGLAIDKGGEPRIIFLIDAIAITMEE